MNSKDKQLFEKILAQADVELHTDPLHRRIYSVDASIYEIEPLAIAVPRTKEALLTVMRLAAEANIPVIARGAATGIAGGCIGNGIIIDHSKYLNRILEVNIQKKYVICEPGVVQDRLNEALKPYGYRLGPDTSTGNRATIGGMLANNSAGARSLYYGRMVDHVLEVELALAGGHIINFYQLNENEWASKCKLSDQEGLIYKTLDKIRRENRDEIKSRFPHIPRRVSGYNLDSLVSDNNVSKLITGSEGSLGIATEIKLNISPLLPKSSLIIVHFDNMTEGMKAIPDFLKHKPISLEMIDDKILEMAKQSPAVKDKLGWLEGNPKMVFVAEMESDTPIFDNIGYATTHLYKPEEMQHVWDVRKAGLGLLLSKHTYNRAIAFIEDVSVAPEQLAIFIPRFLDYLKSQGKEAGIYGHVGSGCMHIRPYVDLRSPDEAQLMKKIVLDVADMLLEHGGALSGEHGDGIVRSWLNEKMFGPNLYRAFKEIKHAFDPKNLMNPGKIVDGQPFLENLRTLGEPAKIPTFLDFSREGGIELSADLCNGNGMCRKKEGLMCPSFQATNDEYDTTRARAQALREIITGRASKDALTSPDIMEVLDLCLECKGCKKECPSTVDMAKMKAELLYQYQQRHGYSMRSRLFAHLGTLFSWAAPLAALINSINNSFLGKWTCQVLGITTKRQLPQIAKKRFSQLYAETYQPPLDRKVALFNDTFTEFNYPEIGLAAIEVLNALGYRVELIPWTCCGRPMISKGFLRQAKEQASKVKQTLSNYHMPVIVLEPSCASALLDDYTGLLGSPLKIYLFDQFINENIVNGRLPIELRRINQRALLHGHCHQKALIGMNHTLKVLHALPGLEVTEIPSGCCGMAGSFGYESEHYEISMKIGNLKLFPTVNESPDHWIIADGTSCRSQIQQGTERQALHLAEVLRRFI